MLYSSLTLIVYSVSQIERKYKYPTKSSKHFLALLPLFGKIVFGIQDNNKSSPKNVTHLYYFNVLGKRRIDFSYRKCYTLTKRDSNP